jgi:hypothetical protein
MMTARRVFIGLIVVLALIQFVPVTRSNPPVVDGVVFSDPNALAIAKKACFDCHSNENGVAMVRVRGAVVMVDSQPCRRRPRKH